MFAGSFQRCSNLVTGGSIERRGGFFGDISNLSHVFCGFHSEASDCSCYRYDYDDEVIVTVATDMGESRFWKTKRFITVNQLVSFLSCFGPSLSV